MAHVTLARVRNSLEYLLLWIIMFLSIFYCSRNVLLALNSSKYWISHASDRWVESSILTASIWQFLFRQCVCVHVLAYLCVSDSIYLNKQRQAAFSPSINSCALSAVIFRGKIRKIYCDAFNKWKKQNNNLEYIKDTENRRTKWRTVSVHKSKSNRCKFVGYVCYVMKSNQNSKLLCFKIMNISFVCRNWLTFLSFSHTGWYVDAVQAIATRCWDLFVEARTRRLISKPWTNLTKTQTELYQPAKEFSELKSS